MRPLACKLALGFSLAIIAACATVTSAQLKYWRDSEAIWQHTVEVAGESPVSRQNLGSALVEKRKFAEAAEQFRLVLQKHPLYAEAESNYGFALAMQGHPDEAIEHYRNALVLKPRMETTRYLLGGILLAMGKRAEAMAEFETTLDINPNWPPALNDLAWMLATDPDASVRNGERAVELAERACRVTLYQNPQFIGTLAAAYAEAGKFESAIAAANQAITLARGIGREDLATRNEQLLQTYRAQRPYREPTQQGN